MASSNAFDDGPTDPFRTLDPEERLALHGEVTGDDLLAAVLADPANDEPRLVYGDYLLEHDDPRGEYIQLQLEQARLQRHDDARWHRMRELARDRIAEWCAPLYPALVAPEIEFRRGFLWRCRAQDRTIALRDVIGHPMWRTVGDLDSSDETLVEHVCLRSLATLRTTPTALAALATAPHESRIEKLMVQGIGRFREYGNTWEQHREEPAWASIQAVGALRHVRTLALYNRLDPASPRTRELLASPLGRQLATLEYWIERCAMQAWPELLAESSLQRLIVHTGRVVDHRRPDDRGGVMLERDGAAWKLAIVIHTNAPSDDTIATAVTLAGVCDSIDLIALDGPLLDEMLAPIRARLETSFAQVNVRFS